MPEDIDDAGLLLRLRETSLDSAAQQLRIIHELKQWRLPTIAELYSGRAPAETAADAATLRGGAADYLYDLARLSTRISVYSHEQWVKLSARHFDYLRASLPGLGLKPAPTRVARSRLSLRTKALTPQRASVRLIIENPLAIHGDTHLTTPLFRDQYDGATLPAGVVMKRLSDAGSESGHGPRLGPHESGRFELTFTPTRPFVHDGRYVAELHVLVGSEVVGRLSVEVEGPAPGAPPEGADRPAPPGGSSAQVGVHARRGPGLRGAEGRGESGEPSVDRTGGVAPTPAGAAGGRTPKGRAPPAGLCPRGPPATRSRASVSDAVAASPRSTGGLLGVAGRRSPLCTDAGGQTLGGGPEALRVGAPRWCPMGILGAQHPGRWWREHAAIGAV